MKSLLTAIIVLLTFSITNQATADDKPLQGQAKIDSLLAELPNAKGDTNEVNLLVSLSSVYYRFNPNKGIEFGKKGLDLSKKLKWKKGETLCLRVLGVNFAMKNKIDKAIDYFNNALMLSKEIDYKAGTANTLGNLGLIYMRHSNYTKALEYFGKAIEIHEELGNKSGIAVNLVNTGIIYNNQSNYPKALEYYGKALKLNEELGKKSGIAANLVNVGLIYMNQSDYSKALEYYGKALKLNEELGNKSGIAVATGNMGVLYVILSRDSININPSETNEFVSLNKEINLNTGIEYLFKSINTFEEIGELHDRSHNLNILAHAYELKGNYKKAYEAHVKHKRLQDSIFNIDKEKEIATLTAVREKEVTEKELVISQLENDQRKQESYALYGGLALLALVVIIIFRQRRQSERLLLNILPAKIAKRLKKRKGDIADDIENASTVFIDLVGFTEYSKDKKASDVLKMLNQVFSRIDKLVLKHGLEKIKTIGDGYMAAAGVPEYQEDHSKRAAEFALDVHRELNLFNQENGTNIKARIGIESGEMVAGVIGDMKFIYDLWGDSVNTASRMESTGTPNKVHVTENFKLELENHQNGFAFSEPIEMDIKG